MLQALAAPAAVIPYL